MLNKEDVTHAYEHILGRSPENTHVIEEKLQTQTRENLCQELIASEEFQERYLRVLKKPHPDSQPHSIAPHMAVETDVDTHIMEQLFANTARTWDKLGNEDAYWSVLTHDEFRKDVLPQNMEAFEKSSEHDFWMMERAAELTGRPLNSFNHMVELGCGVGRVTKRAAPYFKKYTAVDVSAPHLKLAQERTNNNNVSFLQIGKPRDLDSLPKFDFFFSRLVLQHNAPPVIRYVLETVLSKLSPEGIALFQVPTYHPKYTFDTRTYLSNPPTGMEMHVFPQPDVLKLVRKNRCEIISVQQDRDTGDADPLYVSHTFLVRKSKDIVNNIKSLF